MKQIGPILIAFLIGACSHLPGGKQCAPANTSRCTLDNHVELCGPNGQWVLVLDCAEMGPGWVCKPDEEGHTCVKEFE